MGFVVELGNEVSNGLWSVNKASTWRELKAVYNVLSFATKLEGQRVKWLKENTGVQYHHQWKQKQPVAIFEVYLSHSSRLEVE